MTDITITIDNISISDKDKVAKLIKFKGQLDESNVDEKAKEIYKLIEETPKNLFLIMDFSGLEYMNSKSIGYLTDWYGKISEGGGKVAVASARPNVMDVLEVVGLTQLISFYDTVDEAKLAILGSKKA